MMAFFNITGKTMRQNSGMKKEGQRTPLCSSYYNRQLSNYMFKVNNRNTRTRCEICPKLPIKKLSSFWFLYCKF